MSDKKKKMVLEEPEEPLVVVTGHLPVDAKIDVAAHPDAILGFKIVQNLRGKIKGLSDEEAAVVRREMAELLLGGIDQEPSDKNPLEVMVEYGSYTIH